VAVTNDERFDRIEEMLQQLIELRTVKEYYSTAEVAKLLGKAEFTIREHCRLGRYNAEKRKTGRGRSLEWMISHEELQRIRNEGLLPDPNILRSPLRRVR
jgi:hypothetical protein